MIYWQRKTSTVRLKSCHKDSDCLFLKRLHCPVNTCTVGEKKGDSRWSILVIFEKSSETTMLKLSSETNDFSNMAHVLLVEGVLQ